MQRFRIVIGEAWPFLGVLLLLGWGFLGFVSR